MKRGKFTRSERRHYIAQMKTLRGMVPNQFGMALLPPVESNVGLKVLATIEEWRGEDIHILALIDLDEDLEMEVASNTCAEHGEFLCGRCFDFTTPEGEK